MKSTLQRIEAYLKYRQVRPQADPAVTDDSQQADPAATDNAPQDDPTSTMC